MDEVKHWAKCPFCGALNGNYETPLQEHRPRCRYKGPADVFGNMVPNYYKMIDEDDPHHLALVRAFQRLPVVEGYVKKMWERLLTAGVPEEEIKKLLFGEKKKDS